MGFHIRSKHGCLVKFRGRRALYFRPTMYGPIMLSSETQEDGLLREIHILIQAPVQSLSPTPKSGIVVLFIL